MVERGLTEWEYWGEEDWEVANLVDDIRAGNWNIGEVLFTPV